MDLVGIGVGGWIAAQMAVMCSASLRHLVLVDAAGVRPAQGEILDVFVTPWKQVIEQVRGSNGRARIRTHLWGRSWGSRVRGRTMSMRMCFRPYMYDPALPGMLGKVRVKTYHRLGQWEGGQIYPRVSVSTGDFPASAGALTLHLSSHALADTIGGFVGQ